MREAGIRICRFSLSKIFGTRRFSYFSEAVEKQIEQMRNIDYEALRRQVIADHNEALKRLKSQQNQKGAQYQTLIQKSPENTRHIQSEYNQYLEGYVENCSRLEFELHEQLKKVEQQEKTNIVRVYLADNLSTQQPLKAKSVQPKTSSISIPNRLILKKVYHGTKDKASQLPQNRQLILVGAENQEQHCFFIAKMVEQLGIKNIITMMAPDLPYFIKTEKSFTQEWSYFLEDPQFARKSKFYLNPKPLKLSDVCLHSHHISLVRSGLAKSRSFLKTYYCMMKENEITQQYQPQPLLAGLFPQGLKRVYFAGFPVFQERRMLADSMQLNKLRNLFQEHLTHLNAGRIEFSAQWLFPEEVLSQKLSHFTGIVKAVAESSSQRSMVICPAEMAELFSLEWRHSRGGHLDYNYTENDFYLNLSSPNDPPSTQTFIEFIEKLVILDLIIEPVFTRYFIKYHSFPFPCDHTLGGKENIGKIITIWTHFYQAYFQKLTAKRLLSEEKQKQRAEYLSQFEDPRDFL